MQPIDDTAIIKALKFGNVSAFDEMYYKYNKKLFAFSLKYLKDRAEAEDLIQKVFIIIWERRELLDENKAFERYLFKITRNEVYDVLKKRVTCEYYENYILDIQDPGMDDLERKKLIEAAYQLIDHLPERRAQIFRMSKEEGLTYKQIAEILHITENTVDTQIRHSLNFLRKEMLKLRTIILFIIH